MNTRDNNLDSEQVQERMSAYIDGMLDAEETAAFEAFLADNDDARAELEALGAVVGHLGVLTDPAPPADLFDRVKSELTNAPSASSASEDVSRARHAMTPWFRRAAGIAAVLLIMRVGYNEWREERAPRSLDDVAARRVMSPQEPAQEHTDPPEPGRRDRTSMPAGELRDAEATPDVKPGSEGLEQKKIAKTLSPASGPRPGAEFPFEPDTALASKAALQNEMPAQNTNMLSVDDRSIKAAFKDGESAPPGSIARAREARGVANEPQTSDNAVAQAEHAGFDKGPNVRAAGEKRLEQNGAIRSESSVAEARDDAEEHESISPPAASAPARQNVPAIRPEPALDSVAETPRQQSVVQLTADARMAAEQTATKKDESARLFDAPADSLGRSALAPAATYRTGSQEMQTQSDETMMRLIGSDKHSASISVRATFDDVDNIIARFSKRAEGDTDREKDSAILEDSSPGKPEEETRKRSKTEDAAQREPHRAMRVFKILDHDYAALMRELKAAGLVTLHTAAPERKPGGFFKRKSSTKITVYLLIEPPDSPPAPTAPATPTP